MVSITKEVAVGNLFCFLQSSVTLCYCIYSLRQGFRHEFFFCAPGPVGGRQCSWEIHSCAAAQFQIVLHLNHTKPTNGPHSTTDHTLNQALLIVEPQIVLGQRNILRCSFLKPLCQSQIIVGSGIAHRVYWIGMWQIIRSLTRIKRKLQNLHSGISGLLLQLAYFGCDIAQILGNKFQIRKSFLNRMYICRTRPLLPFTTSGSFISSRDRPITFKSSKMVQPNYIIHFGSSGQPTDPPGKSGFLHFVPIVKGIAPKLTVSRKRIRRTTSNRCRPAITVKLKQFGCGPHIR